MDNHIANRLGPRGPILTELAVIDIRSTRALRAIQIAQATGQPAAESDVATLAGLDAQAARLRALLTA